MPPGPRHESRLHRDLAELLEVAADEDLSPDMLATIGPAARDLGAPVVLVLAVLDHPACGVGVAARCATHPDRTDRLRVAGSPGLPTPALAVLAIDQDDEARAAAPRVLDARAGTMTGDD